MQLRLMYYPSKGGERFYAIETPWTEPYGSGWLIMDKFDSKDEAEKAFRELTSNEPVVLKEFDTFHYEKK